MATATKPYTVTKLSEIERGPSFTAQGPELRERLDVRQHFGITSFGIQAFRALKADELVREHNEVGLGASGQEELYIVLEGGAVFTIDGEEVEAKAGTAVFVQPDATRSAVAKQVGTTILAIGGTPGEAYRPAPSELAEAFAAYNNGDFETAVEKQRVVVEHRPTVLDFYNLACFEARAGRIDDALEHLRRAVEADDRIRENIRTDDDLEALRSDARFAELVG